MTTFLPENEELMDLLDAYLDGRIDEAQLKKLETLLLSSAQARAIFVRYCRLETDLHLILRSQRAGERTLEFLEKQNWAAQADQEVLATPANPARRSPFRLLSAWHAYAAVAACLLVLILFQKWAGPSVTAENPSITNPIVASITNAKDCIWASDVGPSGSMRAGQVLNLHAGLAEIVFHRGAKAIMEGPALLELLTDNSVRLTRGKLSTRVTPESRGFEVQVPLGKIVDLGTEFGVAVAENDASDVYVFNGRVEAYAAHDEQGKVSVVENQAAHLDTSGLVVDTSGDGDMNHFIRAIPTVPVGPEKLALDFGKVRDSAIRDLNGHGIGMDNRLPGTGGLIPSADPNLFLDLTATHLQIIPPMASLFNSRNLEHGEFIGARLATYGFTGREAYEVNSRLISLPALGQEGQIGLYIGTDSRHVMHAGLVMADRRNYRVCTVNNVEGQALDLHFGNGVVAAGSNVKMSLSHMNGKYWFRLEDQTRRTSQKLMIRERDFLAGQKDVYVGFYAFNARNDPNAKVTLRDFKTLVWTDR